MKILAMILRGYLLDVMRKRTTLILMVALPVIFTFVFGVLPTIGGNNLAVAIVDNDHTVISRGFIQMIAKTAGYQVNSIAADQVKNEIRNQQASVVIVLPRGLEQRTLRRRDLQLSWIVSPNAGEFSQNSGGSPLQLRRDVQQWAFTGSLAMQQEQLRQSSGQAAATAFVRGMENAKGIVSPFLINSAELVNGKIHLATLSSQARVVIGFSVLFIILIIFSSTSQIFREKTAGTWARLKASPASRAHVLAGYGSAFFVTGWLQFLIMYLSGRFLFGIVVPMNPWVVLVISLYVLAVCGIALCIAGLVKSGEQHMMLGSFVAISTSMIGGAYWPVELEPVWMQHVSWFVPQSWVMTAYQAAAGGDVSFAVIGLPLSVLAVFAVAFFGAGMLQFKYT